LTTRHPDEDRLVRASRRGDVAAFEELVYRYQDRVFNLVYRLVGDFHDACDLTQETFLKAFQGLAGFRGKASFFTWLYRIAVNSALSLRKRARHGALKTSDRASEDEVAASFTNPDDRDEPVKAALAKEQMQLIEQAIASLEEELRVVVILRDIEELDYSGIAHVLEIPRGTVKSRSTGPGWSCVRN
jgi:RNA polymerase sigma-70 factor (ECF subfamily)